MFNPLLLYSFFIFNYSFNLLNLSILQHELTYKTNLIICLSIVFFIVGVLIYKRTEISKIIIINSKSKVYVLIILMILSITAFIVELFKLRYIPIFNILTNPTYSDSLKVYTPLLNTFILASFLIPAWSYILYKEKILTKRKYVTFSLISSFIIINHLGGRQMILILLLSILLTYNYYYNLKFKAAMIILPVFITLFLFIGLYRSGRSDYEVYEKNMRNYAGIYKYDVTIIESFLTIYSSLRYTEMEKVLKEREIQDYWGYGRYTFRPIIKMTPLKKIHNFNNPDFDTLNSLCTYSIEPYLDFGYIGVIVINLLYGLYSTHVYLNYKNKSSPQYIITFTIVTFCIIMMSFTNIFNTFFIWLMYGINKLLTN